MTELPMELVIGWSLWVIGGLLLTLWFVRRSAAPRSRDVAPMGPPTGAARFSGTHAVAVRPVSGNVVARGQSATHAVAGTPSATQVKARSAPGTRAAAVPTAPGAHPQDAFDELRALLDAPTDPNRTT